jgi:pimeloyl-ACP methyl ester carboxylesterase
MPHGRRLAQNDGVARIPAPGRIVDAGGVRLHLDVKGDTRPVVVFDAALGASSLSWALVVPAVSAFARTCTYDRAGFGWSEAGPLPRTVTRIAGELRLALEAAGERPPFLLVGHSFGGLVMRVFAARYLSDVAGLVLVDPAHPEDWANPAAKEQDRIDRGVRLCGHGRTAARLGLARLVAWLVGVGAVPLARRLANLVSRRTIEPDIDFILAPFFKLPPEVRAPVRQFWTRPAFFEALGSQIASMHESAAEAIEATREGYGDLPLVTISRASLDDHTRRRQDAVAALSSHGRHIVARRGGHWIPLDDPDLIVDEIRAMHGTLRL